jgi:hypothetical protein
MAPYDALIISEIVSQIIASLDKPSIARAALVTTLWRDIAIELLWSTLDDWHALLKTAGNLTVLGKPPNLTYAVYMDLFCHAHC